MTDDHNHSTPLSTGPRGSISAGDAPRPYTRGTRTSTFGERATIGILFVLLVASSGTLGGLAFMQQRTIDDMRVELNETTTGVNKLQTRLQQTDDLVSTSGEDTDSQIALWESEIRKLWDVSNVRNKRWIEDNQTAIAQLKATTNAVKNSSDNVARKMENQEQRMGDLNSSVSIVTRQQRDIADTVNANTQQVAQIRETLTEKVNKNENGILAIDAFRRSTTNRINEVSERTDEITRRVTRLENSPALQ